MIVCLMNGTEQCIYWTQVQRLITRDVLVVHCLLSVASLLGFCLAGLRCRQRGFVDSYMVLYIAQTPIKVLVFVATFFYIPSRCRPYVSVIALYFAVSNTNWFLLPRSITFDAVDGSFIAPAVKKKSSALFSPSFIFESQGACHLLSLRRRTASEKKGPVSKDAEEVWQRRGGV